MKNKKNLLFPILAFGFCATLSAQKPTQKKLLPESRSLVGMWHQQASTNPNDTRFSTGNYKVIAADSTFYTFVVAPQSPGKIWVYGTISNMTDSSFVENIVHATNESLIGKGSPLKYRLIDENTLQCQYKLEINVQGEKMERWVPELWKRVEVQQPFKNKKDNLIITLQ